MRKTRTTRNRTRKERKERNKGKGEQQQQQQRVFVQKENRSQILSGRVVLPAAGSLLLADERLRKKIEYTYTACIVPVGNRIVNHLPT